MQTYAEALQYIYSFTNYERKQMPRYDMTTLDLERIRTLLAALGNPQERYPALLIAGTKGKGSTAAMAESILRAGGYTTGLFTSPHLHTFRERIRVSGEMISEEELLRYVELIKSEAERIEGLTAFEIISAIAFRYFADKKIDMAVLEVGLGGRLDATNVVNPAAAVITSISFDHTQILGNTLSLIAREKAGIIHPGSTVITAPQYTEALESIEQVCRSNGAELIKIGRDWQWVSLERGLKQQRFKIGHTAYTIPLLGVHQQVNAVTAMAAVHVFVEKTGFKLEEEAYARGLEQVDWPGRLEVLSWQPALVVDSAHNGDSARKLRLALEDLFPYTRLTLVFGASADKDIEGMLEELLPAADSVIAVPAAHPRAMPAEQLAEIARKLGREIDTCPSVRQGLELALQKAKSDSLICVTGSIFTVAEARMEWFKLTSQPLPPADPLL
jgi:dihydrofolate synthase / folylpolyglutamate synthase